MQVIKRNNKKEPVSFDKVIRRIENLCGKDDRFSVLSEIQTVDLAKNIIMTIVDNITTKELDNQAIKACMSVSISEPEYGELAKRFYVSSMHKEATSTFYETAEKLYEANLLHHTVMKTIRENKDIVNSAIDTFRDYNLDYFGLKTLEKSYLIKAKGIMETPQYLFMRVSLGLYKTNLTEAFKSYYFLSQKMFTHASPTLFNSGTIREQNSSCFLLGTEDSIEGIMKTYTSCAYYSKWSGGIGIHVSNIRSKGSLIRKTNGKSDGIIPMLKVYNELSLYINQGGKRNGSFAIYLEPHHADVLDFLKIKNGTTDQSMACKNLFTALWISDYFMECVNSGDNWYLMCPDACPGLTDAFGKDYTVLYKKYVSEKKFTKKIPARVLFKEMLSAQTLSGSPYVLFKDSINIKNNQKHLGTIKSSNLCVAPETKILTSNGYFTISELKDQKVSVWNGSEFSETTVKQTSDNSELMKITTSSGSEIDCTLYHRFHVVCKNVKKSTIVEAKDLKLGDRLIKCEYPVIESGKSLEYAYTHGFFSGDGCAYKNQNTFRISLYGEKMKLLNDLHYKNSSELENIQGKKIDVYLYKEDNFSKDFVPINYNLESKLEWLAGICDSDGCVTNNSNYKAIQISSIDFNFLTNVKYLLQTLGCDPKISLMHLAADRLLPDANRNLKMYSCKDCFRLLITSCDTSKLVKLGFSPKRLNLENLVSASERKRFVTITKKEFTKRFDKTFCFTEPKKNLGVFNGLLLGNCAEITLFSDSENHAVCNLISICLSKYNNNGNLDIVKLEKVIRQSVRNLNQVIDNNFYPTKESEKTNLDNRPIGIGVQGLANLFYDMKISFESKEAKEMNLLIFETIQYYGLDESCKLAKKHGSYPNFKDSPASKGIFQHNMWEINEYKLHYNWENLRKDVLKYGLRNSTITALPPTASTSQIMGNFESFEPITSNVFIRNTLSGSFPVINNYLVQDLKKLNLWTKKIKTRLISENGSIQNILEIPEETRKLYKTVWEIPQKVLIELSADRSPFICQSQSLNLYMKDPDQNKLYSALFYGWKLGLKTGMYYLRTFSSTDPIKFTIDDEICLSCSA